MPLCQEEASGWTSAEAASRLAADGPNELPAARPLGRWRLLAEILGEPMLLLLVACGTVYLLLGDRQEALMLLAFVLLVIGISYVQRARTERSLAALRDLSSPRALVIRDGRQARIASRDLVRGDLLLLAEGDRVPADVTLLAASNLMVDESMLTGEAAPVMKQPAPRNHPGPGPDGCVYAGTLVTQGTASGTVSATGTHSALGRIGASLATLGGELTPVQQETRRVVRTVAIGALGLAAALGVAYWWLRGDALRGLLAGLTLAMALLPEELPLILTLFLALGAWRLARAQVLARSIPAIELLGATTVLCVDKTGTLTCNRMQLCQLWSAQAHHACGPAPEPALPDELHRLLEYAVLASHRQAFDPMEAAIGAAGARLLAGTEHLHGDWSLVDDYPLSRRMLAMSRVWRSPGRRDYVIAAKGAPEAIMDLCHLDTAQCAAIAAQVAVMAGQGLRVIGVAAAAFAAPPLPSDQHDFDFDFLGLLALEDPVRPEVPAAVAQCRDAGMRVVMITGDHPATALSVARQAGIATDGEALTGVELDALDDAALRLRLAQVRVCCRIAPQQKLRLVQAMRARGDIVAMTGDGVNDAPALKAAHIGVAMGARGTDVAREAAALVLLQDDFSSLLTAVRHGRRLFANLRKAIVFIVAIHVPIAGLSILPVLLGWPLLLLPVHILFLQLIIDPACSVVFEAEPVDDDAMRRPPRPPGQSLFCRAVLLRGLLQGGGLLAMLLCLGAYMRVSGQSDEAGRAAVFLALALSNLALIHANPRAAALRRAPAAGANPYFGWISGACVLLLLLVLGVPALRQLFAFAVPGRAALALCCLVPLLALAWCALLRRHGPPASGAAAW